MTVYIVAIVEGLTETVALEPLLHRIWRELLSRPERLQVVKCVEKDRSSLVHMNGVALSMAVEVAAIRLAAYFRRNPDCQALLLIEIDAEKDCPALLGPRLTSVAKSARGDLNIACVLAKRMFENWIVAGASALGGVLGLPDPIPARSDVEEMSGSTWLDKQLRSVTPNSKYKKADHAVEFVKAMDLVEARGASKSFDRLCKKLESIPPVLPPSGA